MSGIKEFIKHCTSCDKETTFIENKINHLLHAILTIFLFGTWLIVWICIIFFKNRKTQCKVCGHSPKGEKLDAFNKNIEEAEKKTSKLALTVLKVALVGGAIVMFIEVTGILDSCDIYGLCTPF